MSTSKQRCKGSVSSMAMQQGPQGLIPASVGARDLHFDGMDLG